MTPADSQQLRTQDPAPARRCGTEGRTVKGTRDGRGKDGYGNRDGGGEGNENEDGNGHGDRDGGKSGSGNEDENREEGGEERERAWEPTKR